MTAQPPSSRVGKPQREALAFPGEELREHVSAVVVEAVLRQDTPPVLGDHAYGGNT